MDNPFCRRCLLSFWLALALLAGLIFIFRLDAMVRQGSYYVTTGCEDISVFNVSRMRYGDPVYTDCFTYPYRASLFNWLFYQMHGTVARLTQPSEVELPTVLRLVTLMWAVAGFVAMVLFLRGHWVMSASVAAVAWFGPMIGWWTMTVRPDVPAVVCQYIAFTLVARGGSRLSLGRAVATGLVFFTAWSFKQSGMGILAGTLLALAIRREWFNLAVVASAFAAPTALVLLIASPEYYINLIQAPALAPFTLDQLQVLLFWLMVLWGPLLALGPVLLVGMAGTTRRELFQDRPVLMLAVVFAVTLTLNVLAARRPGGSQNYFFESWLIGLTLTAMLGQHAMSDPEAFASLLPRSLLVASAILLLGFTLHWTMPLFDPLHKPDTAPVEIMLRLPRPPYAPELLDTIRSSPKPILCDDTFLALQALGPDTAGLPVIDHTIYWDAMRAGRLSEPDVMKRIEKHEYVNIWLYVRGSEWEQAVRDAGYVPVWEDETYRQYRRPAVNSQ